MLEEVLLFNILRKRPPLLLLLPIPGVTGEDGEDGSFGGDKEGVFGSTEIIDGRRCGSVDLCLLAVSEGGVAGNDIGGHLVGISHSVLGESRTLQVSGKPPGK